MQPSAAVGPAALSEPLQDATPAPAVKRTADGWERERDRSARTQAEKSRSGRDIAEAFPAVVDADRRESCRLDFERFCKTYLVEQFGLEWSDDHREAARIIQEAVLTGGLFAYAMPRGSGKTTLARAAVLWALLYGHSAFVCLVAAAMGSAVKLLNAIKLQLERNDLLLADFPEACYPIRRLEGRANRAVGQLVDGERTYITWARDTLVLPTVPAAYANGSRGGGVVVVSGIGGGIRGLNFPRPDGTSVRPDLVVVDDPQTKASARSKTQCEARVEVLCGDVLGLAGPGKKIAGVMPCTVIVPGDMADEMLDRTRHPEWQGKRTKLVYAWPVEKAEPLWDRYRELWKDRDFKAATSLYRRNRRAMDEGSHVAWPARHEPDELSALQHAINWRMKVGEAAFAAEFQNEPLSKDEDASAEKMSAAAIAAKFNNRGRGEIPHTASILVSYIDVQQNALFAVVSAFERNFTGYVVDYGIYPPQPKPYFSYRAITHTLKATLGVDSDEAAIYQGLVKLTDELLGRVWKQDGGAELRIQRCLIDTGYKGDVVAKFIRESKHAAVLLPAKGVGVTATKRPFSEYKRKAGDRIGPGWRIPNVTGKRVLKHALIDTNAVKTFVEQRWFTPAGGRGALTVFGKDAKQHQLFSEHCAAENPQRITNEERGHTVVQWDLPPSKPDNHWKDGVTGCHAAASIEGASLEEIDAGDGVRRVRKRIKLSDLQKSKQPKRWSRG